MRVRRSEQRGCVADEEEPGGGGGHSGQKQPTQKVFRGDRERAPQHNFKRKTTGTTAWRAPQHDGRRNTTGTTARRGQLKRCILVVCADLCQNVKKYAREAARQYDGEVKVQCVMRQVGRMARRVLHGSRGGVRARNGAKIPRPPSSTRRAYIQIERYSGRRSVPFISRSKHTDV